MMGFYMTAFDTLVIAVIIIPFIIAIGVALVSHANMDADEKVKASVYRKCRIIVGIVLAICTALVCANGLFRFVDSWFFTVNLKAENAEKVAGLSIENANKAVDLALEQVERAEEAQRSGFYEAVRAYGMVLNASAHRTPVATKPTIPDEEVAAAADAGAGDDLTDAQKEYWFKDVFETFDEVLSSIEGLGMDANDEYPAFDYYIGHYEDGVKSGLGVGRFYGHTEEDGQQYRGFYAGSYSNGTRDGYGAVFWDQLYTGDYFSGEWKDGKRVLGVTQFNNGAIIRGDHSDSSLNGYGKRTSSDGMVYYGAWEAGKLSGYGIIEFAPNEHEEVVDVAKLFERFDGVDYIGEVRDNEANGYGKYTFANGDYYLGEVDGGRSGYGTLFDHSDQVIARGRWDQGVFQGWE